MTTLHGTLLWLIDDGATADDLGEIQRRLGELLRWHAHVGLMVVVGEGPWIPDGASRQRTTQLLRELHDEFAFVAVVFEGHGLRVALLRAFLRALTAPIRRPFPLRVFENVDEATLWASAQTHDAEGRAVPPQRLGALLQSLRPIA
ncbi:MAG: hypothetical protein AAF721_29775 [Myxococcota bacterium]